MKSSFWTKDWFAGLLVVIVFIAAQSQGLLNALQLAVYDFGVSQSEREPSDRIAVVAIDNKSLENLGRWPWPRDLQAQLIDALAGAGAKVIGSTVFYIEPQQDAGAEAIAALNDFYIQSSLLQAGDQAEELGNLLTALPSSDEAVAAAQAFYQQSALSGPLKEDLAFLQQAIVEAGNALNADGLLASTIDKSANVILPMLFEEGEPVGNPDHPLPTYVAEQRIGKVVDRVDAAGSNYYPLSTVRVAPPIAKLGAAAAAVGSLVPTIDRDGGLRRDPLVVSYYEGGSKFSYFPSLALQIAAASLNLSPADMEVRLGEGIRLGRLTVGTDEYLQLYSFFYGDVENPAFQPDSAYDVLTGSLKLSKYKDKIVLVGATATGLGNSFTTPVEPDATPVTVLAHVVSSILNEDFFINPAWGHWVSLLMALLVAVYIIALLPKLRAGSATTVTIASALTLLGIEIGLLISQTMWISLVAPTALLILGHAVLVTKRFLVTERSLIVSDIETAATNKQLGLKLQQGGDLDQAFEVFRRLPVSEANLDLLYNLAPEFERKRQFAKAAVIYEYISQHAPDFRDVNNKLNRSRAMEQTVLIGGASMMSASAAATLALGGEIEKPTLGRFTVESELGKGAMGVVYLGKDPKIDRTVAIKTMALAQEFDDDQLGEAKERFFREAQTAGRLQHPNIVTIYDVGEDHDLAYIAMELLKGKDLDPYTKTNNLLPLATVLDIVIAAADALHYAHGQSVVHRDIKPANIMYEPESGAVKLTDFGIARITDSNKTKTGMVLGTPYYMSPEQLAGKRVDGRSDLFSLGVMLYQLTTGALPFKAESMATLMFHIANEPHPDPRIIKSDLPESVKNAIDKALQKDVEERYQKGAEMANDLRLCKAQLV